MRRAARSPGRSSRRWAPRACSAPPFPSAAAAAPGASSPSTRASSRAKYFAGQVAKQAAQAVAEIYGGYALADEYPVSKITAYVNMLNVGEGTPNVQRVLIAEDALGYKDANRHPVRNRAARAV